MSPEQATSAAIDHRSDLFSLGSVLYHLCTGDPPFPGPTMKAILAGVREAEPRPIRDLNPDIPVALEDVIRRLMAKDPADRYPSAREVVQVLADELAEIQGRSSRPSAGSIWSRNPEHPNRPSPPRRAVELDLVDSWDDAGRYPTPKRGAATVTLAAGSLDRASCPVGHRVGDGDGDLRPSHDLVHHLVVAGIRRGSAQHPTAGVHGHRGLHLVSGAARDLAVRRPAATVSAKRRRRRCPEECSGYRDAPSDRGYGLPGFLGIRPVQACYEMP